MKYLDLDGLTEFWEKIKEKLEEKINKENIIDNLESDSNTDVLSAKQGKVLKSLIDSSGNGTSENIIIVGDESDITDDTKLFIDSDELKEASEYYSEVINSLDGDEEDKAPSVKAVNDALKDTYSTEEVKTNKVWIDGKPIYRKVIEITSPSTGTVNINLNIDNYNWFTKAYGMIKRKDNIIKPIPTIASNSESIGVWTIEIGDFKTDGSVNIIIGSSYTGTYAITTAYLIVEYTKTTD